MGICYKNQRKINKLTEFQKRTNTITSNEISQMQKCLCKIECKNLDFGYGIGFLCKIPFPDKSNMLPVLITNNHILEKDDVAVGKNINLIVNNKNKEIKIDNSRKFYSENIYNITIIEVKKNELGISFLEIDDNPYNNIKEIFILHYPNYSNDNKSFSFSEINNINEDNSSFFYHHVSNTVNFIGDPIINFSNNKVIGIHKGQNEVYNEGTLIKKPILDFYNNKKEEKIKNEENKDKTKNIKEDNKTESSTNNSINSNKNIDNINVNEENKIINKYIQKEIKNEKNPNNSIISKNENNNINKNIISSLEKENQTVDKNNFIKNEINNQNQENINNIFDKEEDKEINLIFLIINKELNLDVKENNKFNEVINQLYSKFLWLEIMNIIDCKFNGKSIEKDKTVKENGLEDNSNIELIIKD